MSKETESEKEISDEVLKHFREHKPSVAGYMSSRKSAVCIPLLQTENGWEVLFEVRSFQIAHQPGDICFPGGMIEEQESPKEAAVRELCEELCITPEQVDVIGPSDLMLGTWIAVHPYAVILKDYRGTFSEDEVAEVFSVPLFFFLEHEPKRYQIEFQPQPPEDFPYDKIYGGRDYNWRKRREEILFYEYGDHTIWGLTAKMMKNFADIVSEK